MRCPRCQRESADGAVFCLGCGAPLSLRAEPTAPRLDATLDLDRRAAAAPPRPPSAAGRAPVVPAAPVNVAAPPRAPARPPPLEPRPKPAPAAAAPAPAERPPARPPPIEAPPRLEPVAPPVADRSHWDLRPSQLPRERVTDLGPEPLGPPRRPEPAPLPETKPLPRVREPSDARPAAKPAPPPTVARAAEPSDSSVDVDVGPFEVRLRRAPDGKRIAAWVLDGVPFLLAFAAALRLALDSLPTAAPADLVGWLDLAGREAPGITGPIFAGAVVLFGAYHALAHGLGGATLGKRLVGIRVVKSDGRTPGLGRSTLRAVLAALSLALVGLGVLLALFTPSGRALHDLLARTWVVESP